MSELRTLQSHFWHLVTSPAGVRDGKARHPAAGPLRRWIKGADESFCEQRLDVYANMYFFRLRDILAEDFKAVQTAIGATHFHNLVVDYLVEYPPSDPSLRHLGDQLPQFLRQDPVSRDRPYLADLADFEWSRLAVFDAADQDSLGVADLEGLPPSEWPELPLRLIEACQLRTYEWPVIEMRSELTADRSVQPARKTSPIVIWRRGFRVAQRPLEAQEGALFEMLRPGASFAEVCGYFARDADSDQELEVAAGAAYQTTRRWIEEGLLALPAGLRMAEEMVSTAEPLAHRVGQN